MLKCLLPCILVVPACWLACMAVALPFCVLSCLACGVVVGWGGSSRMPSQGHCASVVSKHVPPFGKVCGPNGGKAIVVVACCHPSQVEVCGFVRCCLFCIGCGCADATSTSGVWRVFCNAGMLRKCCGCCGCWRQWRMCCSHGWVVICNRLYQVGSRKCAS